MEVVKIEPRKAFASQTGADYKPQLVGIWTEEKKEQTQLASTFIRTNL